MISFPARCLAALAGIGFLIPTLANSQSEIPLSSRALPKPVAVAETRLLMEGIANSNYKGLERLLKTKIDDNEAWAFARGQALFVAETGNLLLMRPPKTQGQELWNKSAVELREAATRLARATAARDLNGSRDRFVNVANACNKCHQSFQIKALPVPFQDEKKPAALFEDEKKPLLLPKPLPAPPRDL